MNFFVIPAAYKISASVFHLSSSNISILNFFLTKEPQENISDGTFQPAYVLKWYGSAY